MEERRKRRRGGGGGEKGRRSRRGGKGGHSSSDEENKTLSLVKTIKFQMGQENQTAKSMTYIEVGCSLATSPSPHTL